mmetsp:Transcript_4741/g.11194  ORF Transcript_4741/g.11194 Transcript_4741/m.11194 type:complete len:103 (+) Transcript_4741:85-393(+)|eukprot:1157524-Pelagomonas_calceolata.AAC.5
MPPSFTAIHARIRCIGAGPGLRTNQIGFPLAANNLFSSQSVISQHIPAAHFMLSSCFWLARSTEPGDGYGRCWKRGPPAVVSAARGCAPSRPTLQVPLGASE